MSQLTSAKRVGSASETASRLGFWTALLTTVVTSITFGIAICTPPLSGPFCMGACFEYPYTDIISRFPRDYLWMYPAILLTLLFVVLVVCIHNYASEENKIFSQIGVSFAFISATILLIDYFLQISVIQPSLVNGEFDGIPLFTQYNPHGIFIALEEIGYLMMGAALLCVAPVFRAAHRLERAIRWIFIIGFILIVCALIVFSIVYGIHREYRFEVAVISIDWLMLIVSGVLLSILFTHTARSEAA